MVSQLRGRSSRPPIAVPGRSLRPVRAAAVVVLVMAPAVGGASVGHANGPPPDRTVISASARPVPPRAAVGELGSVTAVAAGYWHSLALRSDGTVVAWGANVGGVLGDGTTVSRSTPVRVCAVGQTAPCTRFLTDVVAVRAGDFHSLALLRDRTVVSWGSNTESQLGDGTTINRTVPVRVCAVGQTAPCSQFLHGIRSISAGTFHNLAATDTGLALAWGSNYVGRLGDGTGIYRPVPVQVCAVGESAPCTRFLSGVRSVAAGAAHSLAVVDNASAVAWGWNGQGQLGDGSTVNRAVPVRVCALGQAAPCQRFLTAVNTVAAGFHSMALRGDGSPAVWGMNTDGQLGDGTTVDRTTPVRVCAPGETAPCTRFLYGVRQIAAGESHSIAQLSSGGVLTWGDNRAGGLGDGTFVSRSTPVRVCAVGQTAPCTRYLVLIRAVSAGVWYSLALQPDYTVAAWGHNDFFQLGDGTHLTHPVPVQVLAPRT
ncbi:hypothetical protein [Micromonospora sp. WMMD714]|uniref:RCC1 domain-containing protein n=1 Tax=Micromonospora sp. WMMD714 TaxID=3016097 RepID=UPI00249A54B2|nr:hypothetical protein [Micromonospora sp. WMMD714]WFE66190.1 hypothetical protein O7625_24145 [Micromonospora sp. WMMD714]